MKTLPLVCSFASVALMSATTMRTFAQVEAPVKPVIAIEAPRPAQPAVIQPVSAPASVKPVIAIEAPQSAQPIPAPAPIVRIVDSANGSEPVVSMVFDETPISDVIKAFRDATGANIISGGTNLQGLVSVRLEKVPWRKGLSSILDPQGLQLLEQPVGSGIYVVISKTFDIPKVTRTFELDFAKATDVAKLFTSTLGNFGSATAFGSANVVIVTASEQQLNECEKIVKSIDKQRSQVYIEARFVELSAAASRKLGLKWDAFGGDGVGVNFDGASLGFKDDMANGNVKKNGNTSSSSSSQNSTLQDNVNNATHDIISDLTTETVLGSGTTHSYDSTKTHNNSRAFTGSMSIDNFSMAINAFEQMDGVSVFSNPKIIVANEETAMVDMTTKEPNITVRSSRSGTSGDQLDITTELAIIPGKAEPFVGEAFFSYGISLKVTPRISPSGLITVDIMPSISERQGYLEISGVSATTPVAKYPIINMRRIQTVFTMESGKTAVIGGLSKTTESSIDSGLPFLRELPWIGPRLFGWKSREKGQKEIVIFVTVGIADPTALKEDVGMPKNAVLSRDLMAGKTKEPGDQTREELMSIKDPQSPRANHDKVVTEREAGEVTPVAVEAPVDVVVPPTTTN